MPFVSGYEPLLALVALAQLRATIGAFTLGCNPVLFHSAPTLLDLNWINYTPFTPRALCGD